MTTHKSSLMTGRRAGAITAVAAASLMLTACGGSDEKLLNEGTLVVAMSGEFQPFSHFEGDQLTGFDYDIASRSPTSSTWSCRPRSVPSTASSRVCAATATTSSSPR